MNTYKLIKTYDTPGLSLAPATLTAAEDGYYIYPGHPEIKWSTTEMDNNTVWFQKVVLTPSVTITVVNGLATLLGTMKDPNNVVTETVSLTENVQQLYDYIKSTSNQ